MPQQKICLFFSDTGGGHRSAAEAIEAGIKQVAEQAHDATKFDVILETIIEKSHPLNRWFVGLYNYFLRHHQSRMKYYYWFIQACKPNNSKLNYWLVAPYLRRWIKQVQPQVMVSVHPMSNHYLANALKDLGLSKKIKLITVITDPNNNLWQGWACPDADLIIAPNDLARGQLVDWGIAPERIKIMGMPVHPDFLRPPTVSRAEFYASLGLDPQKPTVCLNAGWAGGGNMLKIYQALQAVKRSHQVLFLCGHNAELLQAAQLAARQMQVPTVVMPFYERLADLMSHCDLMVTKAGGLTTFEAVARRLPMALDLLTPAMPQESGTDKLLIEQNLAKGIFAPEDIVDIVENLKVVPNRGSLPLPAAHSLNRADAVLDIAHTILAACDPLYDPVSDRAVFVPAPQAYEEVSGALGFESPLA